MLSSLSSSASYFFLLSWAPIWNSDLLMVRIAQGWVSEGFCKGVGYRFMIFRVVPIEVYEVKDEKFVLVIAKILQSRSRFTIYHRNGIAFSVLMKS